MKGKHPKRRKDKYNPYNIWEVDKHYYISFTDGQGNLQEMEISRILYEVFDTFELVELSYLNEWDRHIEQSEVWESTLNDRAVQKIKDVEEIVFSNIQREKLYRAIKRLPDIQRRRLVLHFFGGYTYEQIARYEKCSKVSVKQSVDRAISRLKKEI